MAGTVQVHIIYVGGYKASDEVPTALNSFTERLEDSDWWRINTRYVTHRACHCCVGICRQTGRQTKYSDEPQVKRGWLETADPQKEIC